MVLTECKELQSILAYTRSQIPPTRLPSTRFLRVPDYQRTGEVDSRLLERDNPCKLQWFWRAGVYIAFGRAMGYMNNAGGCACAGAQRSDPKNGDASQFSQGRGPQAMPSASKTMCASSGREGHCHAERQPQRHTPSLTVESTGVQQNQPVLCPVRVVSNLQRNACQDGLDNGWDTSAGSH